MTLFFFQTLLFLLSINFLAYLVVIPFPLPAHESLLPPALCCPSPLGCFIKNVAVTRRGRYPYQHNIIMASLFKDLAKISAYRDRRFPGTQEEFEDALLSSVTVYVGNMSFYTTEEQVYELFTRAGEIKKIVMGLDKNSKTPCGFCFVMYYSRDDAEDSVKYISGTILDDRPIRVDFDWGFQEGRQWGRGRSGGQVRDEYRTDYDPGRGGYGKLVQKELEAQRQLVDYGTGSLGTYPPVMPLQPHYGRHRGNHGHGGSYRHGRDYHRKRHREDDQHHRSDYSKRSYDRESRRNSDHESRPEKNPRFREKGDSDEEDDDDRKRRT